MAIKHKHTLGNAWLLEVDASPDGVTTAPKGSIAADSANGNVWRNTDGATAWANLAVKVVNVASFTTAAVATGTTQTPVDDTIPQVSEGTEFMSFAYTPLGAANKLLVIAHGVYAASGVTSAVQHLHRDGAANASSARATTIAANQYKVGITNVVHLDAVATTSTTFSVRCGPNTAVTLTFNGTGGTRDFGGVNHSSITVVEYTP